MRGGETKVAKIHINKGYDDHKQVEADYWQVEDGFVVLHKFTSQEKTEQVFGMRVQDVYLIERED